MWVTSMTLKTSSNRGTKPAAIVSTPPGRVADLVPFPAEIQVRSRDPGAEYAPRGPDRRRTGHKPGSGAGPSGLTSLGVYVGLSLGLIASSLSLSWALYVLICQRTPEFSPQDDVTEVDEARRERRCS